MEIRNIRNVCLCQERKQKLQSRKVNYHHLLGNRPDDRDSTHLCNADILLTRLHGAISQTAVILTLAAVRT
jgi:hypothetical protein